MKLPDDAYHALVDKLVPGMFGTKEQCQETCDFLNNLDDKRGVDLGFYYRPIMSSYGRFWIQIITYYPRPERQEKRA